ncbi:MAG: AAA family ATPase, partial [Nocardioides sp.]
MTEILDDPYAARLARGASGLLRDFNQAGVLDAADVHVASRLTALAGEGDERVALALALAVRAVRHGSICVDLRAVREDVAVDGAQLPWPDTDAWLAAVTASPVLGEPPVLRLEEGRLLYLDRYWREEQQVCRDLVGRSDPVAADPPAAVLAELFPPGPAQQAQSAAARRALTHATSVLTGGPGTGKTTTVARILALLTDDAERAGRPRLRIALAAPTGKAAARLQQA